MKQYINKIIVVAVGSILMSIGIALYLNAGHGADPLTAFTSGLAKTAGLTVGRASLSIMAGLVIIIFFLDKKRIGLGTVLNAALIGFFVDIFLGLKILKTDSLLGSIIMLAAAAMIFGIGVGIYISAGLGEGAVDAIMILLHEKTKVKVRWVKMGLDVCLLIIGGLLGGKLGAGTVVGVLATGPVVEQTLNKIRALKGLSDSNANA